MLILLPRQRGTRHARLTYRRLGGLPCLTVQVHRWSAQSGGTLDPRSQTQLRWWDGSQWTEPIQGTPREQQALRHTRGPYAREEQCEQRFTGPRPKHRQQREGTPPLPAPSAQEEILGWWRTQLRPTKINGWRAPVITLGLSALFAVALVMLLTGYAIDAGGLRLAGILGALFFGVGAAPLQLSRCSSLTVRLGVAGIVGLSVPTLVATLMVLEPLWHPLLAAGIIGATTVVVHVRACRRALLELRDSGILRSWSICRKLVPDPSIAFSVGGTVLWFSAALSRGHVIPNVGGFLPEISPLWYAGLILLLEGIILARGKNEAYAMFAIVSLVAALTLTPAIVYGMPRTQVAAKHIGFVQQILTTHHLDRSAGIYEAYSGFFAMTAWVCNLARIQDSIGLATYWPFIIGLVGLAELRFFFGRLIHSNYGISVGLTLAVLSNAIGADVLFAAVRRLRSRPRDIRAGGGA